MGEMAKTKELILRGMCLTYLVAFVSYYLQIRGLYGPKGVLPVHLYVGEESSSVGCLVRHVSLACVGPMVGVPLHHTMELFALVGAVLAAVGLLQKQFCRAGLFVALVMCYMSIHNLGQAFTFFNWDAFLMEVGWACALMAPLRVGAPQHAGLGVWLVKWALLRVAFQTCARKLLSGCPQWWSLGAMPVYYMTHHLPTSPAWFFASVPSWFNNLSCVFVYVAEVGLPVFFFSPIRWHRLTAFYMNTFLQFGVIGTANNNFWKMAIFPMSLALVDDAHLGFANLRQLKQRSPQREMIEKVFGIGTAVIWLLLVLYFFRIHPSGLSISTTIGFTKAGYGWFLGFLIALVILVALASLTRVAVKAVNAATTDNQKKVTTVAVAAAATMFFVSLVPFSSLSPTASSLLSPLAGLYRVTDPLHLTGDYTHFINYTGLGARPEIQFEGSDHPGGPWAEYKSMYRPGAVGDAPPFVAPHHPRLDWLASFTAYEPANRNAWMLSLVYKLLQGSKDVTGLLHSSSPWRDTPPKYVRAIKYLYTFPDKKSKNSNWWVRENVGTYLPAMTVDQPELLKRLGKLHLLDSEKGGQCINVLVCWPLDLLYALHRGSNHAWLIFGLLAAMIVACFQMHKVRAKFVVSEEQEEERVEAKVERKQGEARRRKTQKE